MVSVRLNSEKGSKTQINRCHQRAAWSLREILQNAAKVQSNECSKNTEAGFHIDAWSLLYDSLKRLYHRVDL